ncbi:type II toxin-antitoxin system RelE/ParE family toxin [Brevundimonas staleyi]|uniref:Type II toxin-antitoxin system RelE/ParE family toxin n=1 Tax=Brevundimonas staleyi TaxID=74326 RepID=A0ABW0FRQ4_9CAUL
MAARADLRAIYTQSAELFGFAQADAYAASFAQSFARIAAFPQIGRHRDDISPPARVLSHKSHVIIYDLEDDGAVVIRIRHAHEDWTVHSSGDDP